MSEYAACPCGRIMRPHGSCAFHHVSFGPQKEKHQRQVWRPELIGFDHGPCPDCNAGVGRYHHAYCDIERCPRCGGQMLSCECTVPVVFSR